MLGVATRHRNGNPFWLCPRPRFHGRRNRPAYLTSYPGGKPRSVVRPACSVSLRSWCSVEGWNGTSPSLVYHHALAAFVGRPCGIIDKYSTMRLAAQIRRDGAGWPLRLCSSTPLLLKGAPAVFEPYRRLRPNVSSRQRLGLSPVATGAGPWPSLSFAAPVQYLLRHLDSGLL